MERSRGYMLRYPPLVVALLAGAAFGLALAVLFLVAGAERPRLAFSFIAVVAILVAAGSYRRAAFVRGGIEPPPPLIRWFPLHVLVMGLIFGAYWLVFWLIVNEPGESYRSMTQMTVFGVLMGGAITYRSRRWPKGSWRYDAAAAAIVVLLSVGITQIIGLVF